MNVGVLSVWVWVWVCCVVCVLVDVGVVCVCVREGGCVVCGGKGGGGAEGEHRGAVGIPLSLTHAL